MAVLKVKRRSRMRSMEMLRARHRSNQCQELRARRRWSKCECDVEVLGRRHCQSENEMMFWAAATVHMNKRKESNIIIVKLESTTIRAKATVE